MFACLQVNTSPHLVLLDVGMVAELDPGDQQNLVGFFKARGCTTHSVFSRLLRHEASSAKPGQRRVASCSSRVGWGALLPLCPLLEELKTSHAGLLVQALTSQDGEALGHNILDFSDNQTCPVGHGPPCPQLLSCAAVESMLNPRLQHLACDVCRCRQDPDAACYQQTPNAATWIVCHL